MHVAKAISSIFYTTYNQVEGDNNEDQVMLPVEWFETEPLDALNEHPATKETDTESSHIHIETEGSDIMDHICSCTDWDESVVCALKELGSGANLQGDKWEERWPSTI